MGLTRFLRRGRWDTERARELASYLEVETEENIARGMSLDQARLAARRKLGNLVRVREEIYDMNTIPLVDSLWQDLRYAWRGTRRTPGVAVVAIASLALGIGVTTAIFQLIDAIRLRSLPISAPWELAEVRIADMEGARGSFNTWREAVTNPIWERIREDQRAFSDIAAWSDGTFNLARSGEARFVRGLWVSGDFFRTVGVASAIGRVLTTEDDRRGCGAPGVVISDGFWQREYGRDPTVIGRRIWLAQNELEIIGVTPPGFYGLEIGRAFDIAVPLCADALLGQASRLDAGTTWWLTVVGRLRPGWSFDRATAHLRTISPEIFRASLPAAYPPVSVSRYLSFTLVAVPAAAGFSQLRETYSRPLSLLLGLAALVLLIACANLANLMLARLAARDREMAVRLALGASRGRVMRQLLSESLLLALAGAAAGVVVAGVLSRFLVAFVSQPADPWFLELSLDRRVLAFSGLMGMLTCALFGLAPAWRATRRDPAATLKLAGRGLTADGERFGWRRVLVASQLALSLVLLVGALIFARSLWNLLDVDTGFDRDGVLVVSVALPHTQMTADGRRALFGDFTAHLQAVPGVDAASATTVVPLGDFSWSNTVWLDGSATRSNARWSRITGGYFATLNIPLLAGRDFDARDGVASAKVAIVNESFARAVAGDAQVIGKRFWVEQTPGDPQTLYEIVGLVGDTKYGSLREPFGPIAYLPLAQDPRPYPYYQALIRSRSRLDAQVGAVRKTIAELSPQATVTVELLDTRVRQTLLRERLMATLSGFFGVLAALLATIGVYGVIAYMVVQRRNEIGIRIALGAGRGRVIRMILGEAAVLTTIGLAVGLVLAGIAVQPARAFVFGLQPVDPATLALAVALLASVATMAAFAPARRAAKVEPMAALRDD